MINWIINKVRMILEIMGLPRRCISLHNHQAVYADFNSRHPRFPIFRKKMIGVALLPISGSYESYLKSVNGKNSAAYYARKATRNGYALAEIDPNLYLSDIYEINISKEYRQGRNMDEKYKNKVQRIELEPDYRYFGVLAADGRLVAYAWVQICGEIWVLSTLLGHGEHLNQGIMYLLVTGIVHWLYCLPDPGHDRYLMYDTFYGALTGLKQFKLKLGFKPYWVRWTL